MAKRFTDTEKWDKAWFIELSPTMKAVWEYLRDNCDHAGIWELNVRSLNFHVNCTISEEELLHGLGSRVMKVSDDKLLVVGFVEFQYKLKSLKDLNPSNKVHLSVIERLTKVGVFKPLASPLSNSPSPLHGAKDKEKDKEQEKEEGGAGGKSAPTAQPLTREAQKRCEEAWRETLRHFRAGRSLTPQEPETIARAIQIWSASAVELALIGARFEQKTEKFDPAKNVSLSRVLPWHLPPQDGRQSKFERFLNLGTQAVTNGHATVKWEGSGHE